MEEQNRARIFLQAIGVVTCIAPLLLLLNYAGRDELMYPVLESSGAVFIVARGRWDLRRCRWFWALVFLYALVHVGLILLIPWKSGWIPAPLIMVFGIVDTALFFSAVWLIEQLKKSAENDDFAP